MEIDLYSVVIGVIALASFIVPIVYIEYYKNRDSRKLTEHFTKAAQEKSLRLSQFDVWHGRYAIGLDTRAKTVIYLYKRNGKEEVVLLDLTELKRCRISKEEDVSETGERSRRAPTRIDLRIGYLNPHKNDVTLEFYHRENGDTVRDELILAEKWSEIVRSKLTKR